MKKLLPVLLSFCILLAALSGCAPKKETVLPVHMQGSIFGGDSSDDIPLDLRFDPKWITADSNTDYNRNLAAFSALISADTYFRTKDLDRGTPNRVTVDGADISAYDQTVLLTTLGFSDVQYIESYLSGTYDTDPNDSVTMTLGYMNDGRNDIFVIAVRGCFSSAEWNSIFDVGSGCEAYTALTGAHPEWTDHRMMKGLSVAACRAAKIADGFISSLDDPSRKNCVLVTGHSRGGAIAEILGALYEDDPDMRSCTYAFNSSPVTSDRAAENYRTVFNIFDSADFFCDCLPFGGETFYRIGRTLSLDIASSSDISGSISSIKGTDDYRCVSSEAAAEYSALFSRLFSDRDSLYVQQSFTRTFDSIESAEEDYDTCLAVIGADTGLGLGTFCSLSELAETPGGTYSFTVSYCGAAMLQSIGRVLAYGQSACEGVHALFAEEEDICSIADWIMANAADITGGHRLLNSYVLTGFLE